ncbi:MAG: ATP-binding cassette domain-containing protein [Actinobacteria bacterium]|nr:ATP-binding cassette domain-containing protein [Actinomycetota bacterium]
MLEVRDLHVHFPIKKGLVFDRTVGAVRAVDGVDLTIPRSTTLGLVGESGCGKSTVGKAILRLVPLTAGTVTFDNLELSALQNEELRKARRHVQMIFQDPYASLNPRQNVESIITEPIRTHQLRTGAAVHQRVNELLDSVGLPRGAASRYPHEFSGGQRQRIGIARALAAEPDLIIADEPVSALDVSIQAQVINLLADLQEQLGLTYLLISHDLAVVRHISDTVAVMYLGAIVETAPAEALYTNPRHPYTLALLSAVPVPDPVVEDSRHRMVLQGDLPSPSNPPSGCRFHTRCVYAQSRCEQDRPVLRELAPGHQVACHFAEEIAVSISATRGGDVVL